jgi:hypothetical protein
MRIKAMEYGKTIGPSAVEKAFEIARRKIANGGSDLPRIAAVSVAEAYCGCGNGGGGDMAEGATPRIHEKLVDRLEQLLRGWIAAEVSN